MTKFDAFVTALIGATCLTVAVAVGTSRDAFSGIVKAQQSYTCNDIVFSETVNNPSKYADVDNVSTIATTSIDCSMTSWTNANYGNKNETAIKIGGSKSGKYVGSVDLKLNGDLKTDRVIVYATGWSGDTSDLKVGVNGEEKSIETTSDSYVFKAYTFDLASQTNSLTFTNNSSATGKSRTVISKIVFRLYGSGGGGGTSSSSSTSGSSSSEPVQNVVTILPSDGTAVENSNYSIEKQGVTISVNASTLTSEQMRVFKGKTLTVSSSHYISSIQFTCTASDSDKYGPGCFSTTTGSYDYEGTLGIWSGNTKSIAFTASLNQVRITQVVVTYN